MHAPIGPESILGRILPNNAYSCVYHHPHHAVSLMLRMCFRYRLRSHFERAYISAALALHVHRFVSDITVDGIQSVRNKIAMASVSVAEQVKTGVSGLITKPARMTVLCFVSFVVVALACQPRNQHFAGEAQEEGVFANPSSLHDGDVAECSSILKTYSETHHVHSWEQGIVAGSATLTIVS